jgi:starch phosphorylase
MQEREQGIQLTRNREQQRTDTLASEKRAGTTAEEIAVSFRNHMTHSVGRPLE